MQWGSKPLPGMYVGTTYCIIKASGTPGLIWQTLYVAVTQSHIFHIVLPVFKCWQQSREYTSMTDHWFCSNWPPHLPTRNRGVNNDQPGLNISSDQVRKSIHVTICCIGYYMLYVWRYSSCRIEDYYFHLFEVCVCYHVMGTDCPWTQAVYMLRICGRWSIWTSDRKINWPGWKITAPDF